MIRPVDSIEIELVGPAPQVFRFRVERLSAMEAVQASNAFGASGSDPVAVLTLVNETFARSGDERLVSAETVEPDGEPRAWSRTEKGGVTSAEWLGMYVPYVVLCRLLGQSINRQVRSASELGKTSLPGSGAPSGQ